MDFFGYPLWTVLLVCVGVFCASFMDAIGVGEGLFAPDATCTRGQILTFLYRAMK